MKNKQESRSSDARNERTRPQDSLLYDTELPLRKSFYPLGFAIEISSNRPEVLEAAAESFGHRRLRHGETGLKIRVRVSDTETTDVPPAPVRRVCDHLYTMVADTQNQAVMDLRSGANFVWVGENAIRDRLYLRQNFLEKVVYLLLGASVVTDIHAGCVSRRGKGILLCGDSGAGKSTLAYGCARAGWTYTSDDTCYLLQGAVVPRVIGHSHRVRFRPESRELFPELADQNVTQRMEGKPSIELPISSLPAPHTAVEAEVRAIVYLSRSDKEHTGATLLPAGTGARRLSKELFSTGQLRQQHERHLATLHRIPTFELHYQKLADGIGGLEELLDRI